MDILLYIAAAFIALRLFSRTQFTGGIGVGAISGNPSQGTSGGLSTPKPPTQQLSTDSTSLRGQPISVIQTSLAPTNDPFPLNNAAYASLIQRVGTENANRIVEDINAITPIQESGVPQEVGKFPLSYYIHDIRNILMGNTSVG